MTELVCEVDAGSKDTLGDDVSLSDGKRPEFGDIGWESGTMIGLGSKGVIAETAVSSVGFSRSVMVLLGSSGGLKVVPFKVPSLAGVRTRYEADILGGGGSGGGNFSWRKPLPVLPVALPSSAIRSSTACTGPAESDLTSERYSRSSFERASELREGDTRGRENRLRKRDTADPGGDTCMSSSCATESAGERARLGEGN